MQKNNKRNAGINDVKVNIIVLSIIGNLLIQCIENNQYDETKFFIRAADQVDSRPELFFYKNTLMLLKNMIMYHYKNEDQYLDKCVVAINNYGFLGMTEYGKELEKFFKENCKS